MFESLKRKMILDESKKVSSEALMNICEGMEEDQMIGEEVIMSDKPQSTENDAELEQLIEEIPEDDDMQEEILESQMEFIEKFVGPDNVKDNHYSDNDLNLEGCCKDNKSEAMDDMDDMKDEAEEIDLDTEAMDMEDIKDEAMDEMDDMKDEGTWLL